MGKLIEQNLANTAGAFATKKANTRCWQPGNDSKQLMGELNGYDFANMAWTLAIQ